MRFGILEHEKVVAAAKRQKKPLPDFSVGVVRKDIPPASEKKELCLWVLQSLGILGRDDKRDHPAVSIFLRVLERRQQGNGVTGKELIDIVPIGKTQVYYWLNKMKLAGLIDQGKKTVIERGVKRLLSGYYLRGQNLQITLGIIKNEIEDSIKNMNVVSERIENILKRELSHADINSSVSGTVKLAKKDALPGTKN